MVAAYHDGRPDVYGRRAISQLTDLCSRLETSKATGVKLLSVNVSCMASEPPFAASCNLPEQNRALLNARARRFRQI